MKGAEKYEPRAIEQDEDSIAATEKSGGAPTQLLIETALGIIVELFHTPDGVAYAVIPTNGALDVLGLRTKQFRSVLLRLFYMEFQRPAGSQAVQNAIDMLEANALYDGPERDVHVRLAEQNGRIYLDLADANRRVVEIDAQGWRIIHRSPVMFQRPTGLEPIPVPVDGGRIDELREFVNIDDRHWPLLIGYLVGCINPRGPYPLLVIIAEQGSGKSALARLIKGIIDPNVAALRSAPRGEQDLMIAAIHNRLLSFDNLSSISTSLSDALCRLSTGGGYATRQLYTDTEEVILEAMRPVILTGIDDLATRGDLLDRSIILNLPRIKKADRRTERELMEEFEAVQPRVMGALLTAASHALRNLPNTRLEQAPRMADFATWVVASESGTELEPRTFLDAYNENRASANSLALDVSPLPDVLLPFVQSQPNETWEGTPQELLVHLEVRADTNVIRSKGWPKSASSLAQKLNRLAPNLRETGVEIERERTSNRRLIRISTKNAVIVVTPSADSEEIRHERG